MLSVAQALRQLFDYVSPPGEEIVNLADAVGRVLVKPAVAARDQPPFAASAMDGYAVHDADARAGAVLTVIGESAAGHRFDGTLERGQAVRISTGAPLPRAAGRVIIQEDVQRDGAQIILNSQIDDARYVRAAAADFAAGYSFAAPRLLQPGDLALLASMNAASLTVSRRPVVAFIATGDELVMPGDSPGADQIIASNSIGLMAL
ncbi:MAG: molybdopterin molybdenumtransferase MoeA, partial [Paracoccaceae bacterium]